MNLMSALTEQIKCKSELENSMKSLNPDVIRTFKECYDLSIDYNFNDDQSIKLKIDSVLDYLQDELNMGHWSEVPISTRQAFTLASFVKCLIALKNFNPPDSDLKSIVQEALKCIDMGLLLGAPLDENHDLLTQSATVLSNKINELHSKNSEDQQVNKRKSCDDYKRTYESIKGKEIRTLQCPSIEHFNKEYFLPQIPVKLQDCMLHWPASKKWLDLNYLLKVAGNRTVPVEIGSHYTDENWTQKLMNLKDFIYNHYLCNSEAVGYLAQHNLFDQIPELKEDICIPEYCALSRDYENSNDPDINAWFGPEGTVSPLHFDPKDNLLAQVYGTKQLILYSPSDSQYLYPHDNKMLCNTAQVDPTKPDLVKHPEYFQANAYKCLLEAGEMLYIPSKWWHHVSAFDKSFSVSFWWQ